MVLTADTGRQMKCLLQNVVKENVEKVLNLNYKEIEYSQTKHTKIKFKNVKN